MAPSAIPLSPCVIPSKNSSAIPVSDETQAYNLLNTFPNHDTGDYDLLLKCPQNIVTHPSIAHTIKSLRTKNRKVTFDPESEILKVQAMPHPLHDAIYELIGRFVVEASHHILTPTERKCVTTASKDLLLSKTKLSVDKKPQSWCKYPDGIILYSQLGHRSFPRIVFEVGLSESYSDLVSDANQWLLRSSGRVELVVIVKITEKTDGLRARQKENAFQTTFRSLLARYGDKTATAAYNVESHAVPEQTEDLYEDLRREIVTSDWVGSMSAFMEFWDVQEKTPRIRGNRIVSEATPVCIITVSC